MATTPVEVYYDPGKTLTASLFARGSDTSVFTGRSMTEETNRKGYYILNVTEEIQGYYTVHIYEGSQKRGSLSVKLLDTTSTCYCTDLNLSAIAEILEDVSTTIPGLISALNDLSQSNIRTALGMDAADMDDRLDYLKTNLDLANTTIYIVSEQIDQGVSLANNTITAAKYDESTAFPLRSDDAGSTAVFRAASAPTNFADLAITATTGKVTVGTNDDKTGYALSSSGLDLVTTWTVDVTGSLSGSVGSVTGGINTAAGTITTLDGLDTAQDSQHGTTQSAISGLNNLSAAQVNSEVDSALSDYDGPTKAEMDSAFTEIKGATWAATDTLEAIRDRGDSAWTTATGFSTHSAEDVRTEVDSNSTQLAAIVEDTGTTIPAQITALNDLSASEVNAEVDTALADYDAPTKTEMDSAFTEIKGATWSGTTDSLEAIRDRGDAAWTTGAGGSAPTVEEIRAEMDDNSTKLATILADTNELQTNQGNWATATGFSTHSAEDVRTEMDSNSTQLAAIVEDTGTTIPSQISGLNNISTSDVLTQASSALTSYDPPTRSELTTDTNSILSAVSTVDGNVDSILEDTGTTIPAQITGLNDISASDVINYNMGDGRTVLQALSFLRNKWVISGGTLTVYQTDDSTESWTAEMTQTAGNPTSSMDPN